MFMETGAGPSWKGQALRCSGKSLCLQQPFFSGKTL